MRCAWNLLLSIIPHRMQKEVDKLGKDTLQELRLRLGEAPELITKQGSLWLDGKATKEELDFCINTASRYSPWAAASSASGYLTAPGGHRIGICGEAVLKEERMAGFRTVTSLCIRVARDFPGIAASLVGYPRSTLILGAPGWGKTTLLRDLIRQYSDAEEKIAVVDERGELFPVDFPRGKCTDVLTGCPKSSGIENLLRTMGPEWISVDEITAPADCEALIQAANCGVRLLATAHASSIEDLLSRSLYRHLVSERIFDRFVILRRDKSWYTERSKQWILNGSGQC